jgi:chaperonin cofactor prefoldin
MGVQIIRDGQVVNSDKKESLEVKVDRLEKVIQDLQNQIEELKKTINK